MREVEVKTLDKWFFQWRRRSRRLGICYSLSFTASGLYGIFTRNDLDKSTDCAVTKAVSYVDVATDTVAGSYF